GGAGLACVDTADDLGAGLEHEGSVLGALAAGDALDDDLGILVEEDRHFSYSFFLNPVSELVEDQAFASAAALSAPSSMVAARVTSGWAYSARIARPSSTRLPSRRTTSGLEAVSPSVSRAPLMPFATASHAVIPPKTLTNTL